LLCQKQMSHMLGRLHRMEQRDKVHENEANKPRKNFES
jgi:hypothetical protein